MGVKGPALSIVTPAMRNGMLSFGNVHQDVICVGYLYTIRILADILLNGDFNGLYSSMLSIKLLFKNMLVYVRHVRSRPLPYSAVAIVTLKSPRSRYVCNFFQQFVSSIWKHFGQN